ncbi:MAG TPA: hypothetical protein VFN67_25870 [Polyangiales bacterium]|nr:hypothetical protein [Polyangiales bacterium]
MQIKLALATATRLLGMSLLAVAVASPVTAFAQEPEEGEADEGDSAAEQAEAPASTAVTPPPSVTPPAPPLPPAPPPNPFSLAVKGFVAGSIMMQDTSTAGGNYNLFLFGGRESQTDKWMYGGDVRQSQLKFFITGPKLIGAIPTAGFDFDLLGGHQINSVPGAVAPITVTTMNAMGMPVTSVLGNAPTGTSAQGDENLLPRVRLAYLELNWNAGEDIVRIGQFHNLIVPMIAASLSHIGAPLGYGAGQLGWRAPGITYQHTFKLSETTSLAASIQLNRNNWADNLPTCAPGQNTVAPNAMGGMPATKNNCLPQGVSLAEASGLPQVQARLMLSGPPKASPFPMYAPNAWQVHLVGVWDQKDASGLGAELPAGTGLQDKLTTAIVSAGFKASLGPVLIAGHGWYGKNAGSLFGHIFAMQHPAAGDINGFGGWGQVGVSLTPQLALWAFGGIDKPKEADIRKTIGGGYVQNIQLVGMASFVAGPLAFSLEYMRIMSDLASVNPMTGAQTLTSGTANQISLTGAFFF